MTSTGADLTAPTTADWPPVDVLLEDGSVARLRPPTGDDLEALLDLHTRISPESRYFRFFSLAPDAGSRFVAHLLAEDGADRFSLVADVAGTLVGIATAEQDQPGVAEVAFLVDDAHHGRGLGTLLLEHLAAVARDHGYHEFVADVLTVNRPMIDVFQHAGFEVSLAQHGLDVHLRMGIEGTDRAVEAADRRGRRSQAASLRPLLRPRSVVVAGASATRPNVGRVLLDKLVAGGFSGGLYALHPTASTVAGRHAAAHVRDLPETPDLMLVAVPASMVEQVVTDAVGDGVRAVVVVTAGLGELGAAGRAIEQRMLETCRRHGARLVGPNGLGISLPTLGLDATFAATHSRPGGLAVASQSGGVGVALMSECASRGLGLAAFVSLGNKIDVSATDLLQVWSDDDQVDQAVVYLESFTDPLRFARAARTFAEHKPLVAVVGGLSDAGQRAGASHTAAASSPAVVVDALLRRSGVISVQGIDDAMDVATLAAARVRPKGHRLAILGNAGGIGVILADTATRCGLQVSSFAEATVADLSRRLGASAAVTNPVDLGAGADPRGFAQAVEAVLTSGEVDALVVVAAATAMNDLAAVSCTVEAAVRLSAATIPVVFVTIGADVQLGDGPLIGFHSGEAAVRALGRLAGYEAWRSATGAGSSDPTPHPESRKRVAHVADGWADVPTLRALFAEYDVVAPIGVVATSADEIRTAARVLTRPFVVKVADPSIVHRTEYRLVETSIEGPDEAVAVAARFARDLDRQQVSVLIQPRVSGVELAVGAVRHDRFGPVVMLAAGGVHIDVWDDRVFLLPPFGALEVARAIRSLRIWPCLAGVRGEAGSDVAAFESLVRQVGRLVLDVPEVAELDLNPVVVGEHAVWCVDAKLRLEHASSIDTTAAPRLRQLLG